MPLISKERLIIFTRYPETGTTKTRLIPLLGAEGAADLQRQMTEHTLSRMMGLTASNGLTIEVRYDGGNEHLMRRWLGSEFEYASQGDGNLGERMQRAFEDAFKSKATAVVIIGTDIPDLTAVDVTSAFSVLKQKKMALGPAKDGGYYLIGLQKNAFSSAVGELFTGITWGEQDVLKKTLNISSHLGLSYSLLKEKDDVDRPEDIFIWERHQKMKHHHVTPNGISVIIPALNEAHNIAGTITNTGHCSNTEIIVVDGGSIDHTVFIAKKLGATVIESSQPRSRRLGTASPSMRGRIGFALAGEPAPRRLPASGSTPRAMGGDACSTLNSPSRALR